MKTVINILAADWGQPLHRVARVAGAVVALIVALLMIAADGLIEVARILHAALIERSEALAAASVAVLAPDRCSAPVVAPAAPVRPPVLPTLADVADGLMALPARQLRTVTGCRRKVAKRVMVEAWLAMPI